MRVLLVIAIEAWLPGVTGEIQVTFPSKLAAAWPQPQLIRRSTACATDLCRNLGSLQHTGFELGE